MEKYEEYLIRTGRKDTIDTYRLYCLETKQGAAFYMTDKLLNWLYRFDKVSK